MAKVYMTRYLLMPFHAAPLILAALFTLLWWCVFHAGIIGIPLAMLLVSWFFKYCYALLDAVVAGHHELPVLSVEMINPVDEQRPLVQAVMMVLQGLACWWVYRNFGLLASVALGALLLSTLPATVGLLAISDNWLHAFSPLAIARIMKRLGRRYAGALGVILGGAVLIEGLQQLLDSILVIIFFTMLVFMAMYCYVGGVLHEGRIELELETRTLGERIAERDERHHADARAAVLDRAYALLRLKRRSEAWAHLEPWILKHCPDSHPFTEYHALLVATCAWEDPVIGDKIADEYLDRLLASGETGLAVEAMEIRLKNNPAFYPQDATMAARLVELAMLSGRKVAGLKLQANAPA
jgi:hypothetical protein